VDDVAMKITARRTAYAVAAAVILSAVLAAGCTSSNSPRYHSDTYPVAAAHLGHEEEIGRGTLGQSAWSLLASVDGNGQLCLSVAWRPKPLDPRDTACGYGNNQINDEGRGTEPVGTTESADGRVLVFGPAPPEAVQARLSMPTVNGTECSASSMTPRWVTVPHLLPAWYPMAGARWFATEVPAPAQSCPLHVLFHDAAGREVPEPNNF
jgi:hypothetical protein